MVPTATPDRSAALSCFRQPVHNSPQRRCRISGAGFRPPAPPPRHFTYQERVVMFIMRFTERAYVNYTEQDVRSSFRAATRLTFPNTYFDPRVGAEQYNEYLDEFEY